MNNKVDGDEIFYINNERRGSRGSSPTKLGFYRITLL